MLFRKDDVQRFSFKKSANYPAYEDRNCPQSGSNKEQSEIMTGFCVCLSGIQACQ